jgi:hypothetical protein
MKKKKRPQKPIAINGSSTISNLDISRRISMMKFGRNLNVKTAFKGQTSRENSPNKVKIDNSSGKKKNKIPKFM